MDLIPKPYFYSSTTQGEIIPQPDTKTYVWDVNYHECKVTRFSIEAIPEEKVNCFIDMGLWFYDELKAWQALKDNLDYHIKVCEKTIALETEELNRRQQQLKPVEEAMARLKNK